MCNSCRKIFEPAKQQPIYPEASQGCQFLASVLSGTVSIANASIRDLANSSLESVEYFLHAEVMDGKVISSSKWQRSTSLMLNDYLRVQKRELFRDVSELVPTAQKIVDMVEDCRETMEAKQVFEPHKAQDYAKKFTDLERVIDRHFYTGTGPRH